MDFFRRKKVSKDITNLDGKYSKKNKGLLDNIKRSYNAPENSKVRNVGKSLFKASIDSFIDLTPSVKSVVETNVNEIKEVLDSYGVAEAVSKQDLKESIKSLNKAKSVSLKALNAIIGKVTKKDDEEEIDEDSARELDEDIFSFESEEESSTFNYEGDPVYYTQPVKTLVDVITGSSASLSLSTTEGVSNVLSTIRDMASNNSVRFNEVNSILTKLLTISGDIRKLNEVSAISTTSEGTFLEDFLSGDLSIISTTKNIFKNFKSSVIRRIIGENIIGNGNLRSIFMKYSVSKMPSFVQSIFNIPTNLALSLNQYLLEDKIYSLKYIGEKLKKRGGIGDKYRSFKETILGKEEIDTSVPLRPKYSRDDHVNFDNETRVSINTVITGYLADIHKNLSGNKEAIHYDFKRRKWKTTSQIIDDNKIETLADIDFEFSNLVDRAFKQDKSISYSTNISEFKELYIEMIKDRDGKSIDQYAVGKGEAIVKLIDYLKANPDDLRNLKNMVTKSKAELDKVYRTSSNVSSTTMNAFNDLDKEPSEIILNISNKFRGLTFNINEKLVGKDYALSEDETHETINNFTEELFEDTLIRHEELSEFNPKSIEEKVSTVTKSLENIDTEISQLKEGKSTNIDRTSKLSLSQGIASVMESFKKLNNKSIEENSVEGITSGLLSPSILATAVGGVFTFKAMKKWFGKLGGDNLNDEDTYKEHDEKKMNILQKLGLFVVGAAMSVGGFLSNVFNINKMKFQGELTEGFDEEEDMTTSELAVQEMAAREPSPVDKTKEAFSYKLDSEVKKNNKYFEKVKKGKELVPLTFKSIFDKLKKDHERKKKEKEKIEEERKQAILSLPLIKDGFESEAMKRILSRHVLKNIKIEGETVNLDVEDPEVKPLLEDLEKFENENKSQATKSDEGLEVIKRTSEEAERMMNENGIMNDLYNSPKLTAKKIFSLSPLGASYTMNKHGYSPTSNRHSTVHKRTEEYLRKLKRKTGLAFVAALNSGGGGGGGGSFSGGAGGTGMEGNDFDTAGQGDLTEEAVNWARNFKFSYVGDSLGVHMMSAGFKQYFPKADTNCMTSRWLAYPPPQGRNSPLDGIGAMLHTKMNDIFVVALGTNGGFPNDSLDLFMKAVPPKVANVIFVNTNSNVGHRDDVDNQIRDLAKRDGRVGYLDWRTFSDERGRDALYASDDIHMTDEGVRLYMEFHIQGLYDIFYKFGVAPSSQRTGSTYSMGLIDESGGSSTSGNRSRTSMSATSSSASLSNGGYDPELDYARPQGNSRATAAREPDNKGLTKKQLEDAEEADLDFGNGAKKMSDKKSVQRQIEYLARQEGGTYSQGADRNDWEPEPCTADCSSMVYKGLIYAGVPCGYKKGDWLGTVITLRDDTKNGKYFNEIKDKKDIQPGDIILCGGYGHCVTYVGDNQIFHAAMPGMGHLYQPVERFLADGYFDMLIRPKKRGYVGDGGGGGSFNLPNISLDAVMHIIQEPRPKYLSDWTKKHTEAVAERVKKRYFKMFGYDKEEENDHLDENGEVSVSDLTKHPLFDSNGTQIDTLYVDKNGKIVDSKGNEIKDGIDINIVNNYNDNTVVNYTVKFSEAYVTDSNLDEFKKNSAENIKLLEEIKKTVNKLDDKYRDSLNNLVNIVEELRDQNKTLKDDVDKVEIEKGIIERMNNVFTKAKFTSFDSREHSNATNGVSHKGTKGDPYRFTISEDNTVNQILIGG